MDIFIKVIVPDDFPLVENKHEMVEKCIRDGSWVLGSKNNILLMKKLKIEDLITSDLSENDFF